MEKTRSIDDYIRQMDALHYHSNNSGINVLLGDLKRWRDELSAARGESGMRMAEKSLCREEIACCGECGSKKENIK